MWPNGFIRIPQDESWVQSPIDDLANKYDAVHSHGWYRNLDPTLDELQAIVYDGDIILDYSAGTGILTGQFLKRLPNLRAGVVLVDSSPKFLRLALEHLGADDRTAFRLIRYLKDKKRLQFLDEVLPAELTDRRVDVLCSTNAIHLYYDLPDTLSSWARVIKPGGTVLVQSGNINNPDAPKGSVIIDTTVEQIQPIALDLVRSQSKYAAFQAQLNDEERMEKYDQLRHSYFLPVRPLSYYLDALRDASFDVVNCCARPVQARVTEWSDFLGAYHEGVLGWAGGSKRIDGQPPTEDIITLRKQLLRDSLIALFDDKLTFQASWTYITCRRLQN